MIENAVGLPLLVFERLARFARSLGRTFPRISNASTNILSSNLTRLCTSLLNPWMNFLKDGAAWASMMTHFFCIMFSSKMPREIFPLHVLIRRERMHSRSALNLLLKKRVRYSSDNSTLRFTANSASLRDTMPIYRKA